MGKIRKIKDVYYIEFHARGLLYSQPGGSTFKEAERSLTQVEGRITAGEALTVVRHIDLADFFERFMGQAKEEYQAPKTVQRFASTIRHLGGFLKENFPQVRQLAQVTPAVVESYKVHLARTQKVKAVNLTILLVRDILDFGIKLGFLNDNPSLHVRLLPWPATPDRKPTFRYIKAKQLLAQGTGLGKLARLLELPDISRSLYYANLIPLSRQDMYN